MTHKIEPPIYKTPPPYGGTVMDWWAFFLRPHRWQLALWFGLSMVRQGGFRTHALFLGVAIGMVESGRAAEDPIALVSWFAWYMGFLAILMLMIVTYLPAGKLMDKISKEVALFGFRHYLSLPESWHEEKASGEKLQRLIMGRQSTWDFLENTFWHIIAIPAILIALSISLIALGTPIYYIAIYIGYIVSYMMCAFMTGGWLHSSFERYNETLEKLIGGVYEFIVSTATVRLFNLKPYVLERGKILEALNHDSRKYVLTTICRRWLVMDFLAMFWMIVIIALSSYEVIHERLSISAYAAILFFNLTIWIELESFAILYKRFIEQWQGFKRLTHVLNQKPAIVDAPNAKALKTEQPSIEFENVCFYYNEKKSIINDLNLKIDSGQKIGILGPSGAGKSTIVKLLLRFYSVEKGAVKIADQNIKDITIASLQQIVAVIPQDVTLFNHPLIENIRYGQLDATDEEVMEAAKKAYAHDFIMDLPEGYQTRVGERGVKLSGGQRQRIAIARAILKNAPILVLDEATSALDSESEHLIQESLSELMEGKTVIAIAHRLSTISHLDRLIVMNEGRIVEDGSHEELCKNKKSLYSKLWSMQSGGFLGE